MARNKGSFFGGDWNLMSIKFRNSLILEKVLNCELKVLGQRGKSSNLKAVTLTESQQWGF